MMPPSKRRKLFSWSAEDEPSMMPAIEVKQPSRGFAHTVDQLEPAASDPSVEDSTSQSEEESVAAQLRKQDKRQAVESVVMNAVVVQADVTVSADPAAATSTIASTDSAILSPSAPPVAEPASTPDPSIVSPTSALSSLSASAVTTSTVSSLSSSTSGYTPPFTSKNITVAGDILTSNLTFSSSSSRTSTIFPSAYSNSSISFNLTTSISTTFSSETSSSTSESVYKSTTYTTLTTTGADGQRITITSAVGAPSYGTPTAPSSPDATNAPGTNDNPTTPPPGTIAGGVVGGAAGLAVLLLIAMLFLRWYRQKAQRKQQDLLPAAAYSDSDLEPSRDGPGMAESAGVRPLLSAMPVLFRHHPGKSRNEDSGVVSSERGFQRLSGRKLPSAFSPGLESGPHLPMPYNQQYRGSGASSVYPPTPGAMPSIPFTERQGSISPEDSSGIISRQTSDEQMTMLPGPQRRPTIHNTHPHLEVPGAPSHSRHVSSSARTSGVL